MAAKVWISPLNPLRFTPLDEIVPKKYNTKPFDKTSYYDYIQEWEQKKPYFYKVQRWATMVSTLPSSQTNSDPIPIHIITSQSPIVTIKLLDCYGIVLASDTFEYVPNAPTSMNNAFPVWYQQYLGNLLNGNTYDDGIYYFALSWEYNSYETGAAPDKVMEFLSEPMLLKDKHENTILIEYSNSEYKDFMPFEHIQPLVMRVEGRILDLQPKLNSVSFEDQNYNTSLLSSQALRGWTFFIGGDGDAVPEYEIDKVNHIISCNNTTYDGKRFTIEDGASIKKEGNDSSALYYGNVKLLEYNNHEAFIFEGEVGIRIVVCQFMPITYPYAIYAVKAALRGGLSFAYERPFIINQMTEKLTFLGRINSYVAAIGRTGTFDFVLNPNGGEIYDLVYNLGANENEDTNSLSSAIVLTDYFTLKLGTKGVIQTTKLQIQDNSFSIQSEPLVYQPAAQSTSYTFMAAGYAADVNATAHMSGTGAFEFPITFKDTSGFRMWNVFYTQTIRSISIVDQSWLIGITNLLPRNMAQFTIQNAPLFEGMSMDTLKDSKGTLQQFAVIGTNAIMINGYDTAPTTTGWTKLNRILLQQNKLPPTVLDDFLNKMLDDHNAGIFTANNGIFRGDSQIPFASLTPSSAVARANLISTYNCTIINN